MLFLTSYPVGYGVPVSSAFLLLNVEVESIHALEFVSLPRRHIRVAILQLADRDQLGLVKRRTENSWGSCLRYMYLFCSSAQHSRMSLHPTHGNSPGPGPGRHHFQV